METLEEIRRGELEPRNLPPIQVRGVLFHAMSSIVCVFVTERVCLDSRPSSAFQVLVGSDENDGLGPWYFSLNNRRLWVLKQCHREGLLDNERYSNLIAVRIRALKGGGEAQRYTVDSCSLEAKFTREGKGGGGSKKKGAHKKKGAVVPSEMDGHSDGDGNFDTIIEDSASKNTPSYPSGHVMRTNKVGNENNETAHDSDDDSDSDSDDSVAHLNPCSALL
jgi:hypothetical protein